MTTLEFKIQVATQLGKRDAATANVVRDAKIREGVRRMTEAVRWNWNEATASQPVSLGYADFPANMSAAFAPKGVTCSRTALEEIPLQEVALMNAGDQTYAVDKANRRIYTKAGTAVFFSYQKKPLSMALDGSDDAVEIPMPDPSAMIDWTIAHYWLGAERDLDAKREFDGAARRAMIQAKKADGQFARKSHPYANANVGWNE